MKLPYLQSVSARWFAFLGRTIGKNPHYFIFIPILISLCLSHSIFRIKVDRDVNKLFTAVNGRAIEALNLVKNLFDKEASFATVARQTIIHNVGLVQATPRDEGSIFRQSVFREFKALDQMIRTFNTTWNGNILNYPIICAKAHDRCVINKVLELGSHIEDDRLKRRFIKYPLDMNNLTLAYKEYVFSLGGVETDKKGFLEDAKAIRLLYIFDIGNSSKQAAIRHWRRSLNQALKDVRFQNIKYTFLDDEKIEDELTEMSNSLFADIPIVILTVGVFSFFSSMTDNLVRSKPHVGISSCISALLAIVSGFGLCLSIGVPCTDYHLILAFGVLVIEVDDAFILIASWRKTNPKDSVPNRLRQAYSGTGVSITITSMTNIISFLIGVITPFPIIRYLCIYSAVTIFFSYVYQITFFGGCLALDGYREERQKHPITLCSKGIDESPSICESDGIEEEFFMRKFKETLGCALSYPLAKVIIFVLFFANLGIGLWGMNLLLYGSDFSAIMGDKSELKEILSAHFKYFYHYSYPIHVIIDYPLNYADPKIQMALDEVMEKLESHPHIADSSLRISWMKYYKLFANSIAAKFSLRHYNLSNKADFIDGLHNVFLNIHNAKEFREDIVFNEDYTEIVATRFLVLTKNIPNSSVELQIKDYAYSVADQSPIPVKIFCPSFHLVEQAHLIKGTTFITAAVTGCLILFVFYVFVPNLTCSFCISSVVICMFFETVGYMSLWNVNLDICSLITLIVCIGFSINYPMHISFCYVHAYNMKPEDRVRRAVFEVGLPIVQGSLSTLLGIFVLAFGNFYAVRSAFKVVFIMTLQTAFHSLFFILVLLSAFGVCDRSLSVKEEPFDLEVQTNMLEGKNKLDQDEESQRGT